MSKYGKVLFFFVALACLLTSCDYAVPANYGSISLAATTHEREGRFIADYTVSQSEGTDDKSDEIQNLLNQCQASGGGTVYIPAGKYRVTKNIYIPSYVYLCGEYTESDRTIIIADVPENDSKTEGLFNIGGSSGVMGLTVYYPNQSLESVKKYPFTFYVDGAGSHYMMQTVKNCIVINGYRGIGACGINISNAVHEMLMIDNFSGTFLLEGCELYNQADVGIMKNITICPEIWADFDNMDNESLNKLREYTRAHSTGMVLSGMDWPQTDNVKIKDCETGIKIIDGTRCQYSGAFSHINISNCSTGMHVKALDSHWGIDIFDSSIDESIVNESNGIIQLSSVSADEAGYNIRQSDYPTTIVRDEGENDFTTKPITDYVNVPLPSNTSIDCSDILQEALNNASEGSVVYVKSGFYRFDHPITVPEGVELRGCAPMPQRDNNYENGGTVFLCYDKTNSFITLNSDSGLCGIKIIYPTNMNVSKDLRTAYAVKGNGDNIYILNCEISGSYYGIDLRVCNNHFIKQVCCCCYKNTLLLGGSNGVITDCLQNGTVLIRNNYDFLNYRYNEYDLFDKIFDPILRKQAEYIILDNAQNETIENVFSFGSNIMIKCINHSLANVMNVGADYLGGTMFVVKDSTLNVANAMRYSGKSSSVTNGTFNLWNNLVNK